jgi:hypothetical protein
MYLLYCQCSPVIFARDLRSLCTCTFGPDLIMLGSGLGLHKEIIFVKRLIQAAFLGVRKVRIHHICRQTSDPNKRNPSSTSTGSSEPQPVPPHDVSRSINFGPPGESSRVHSMLTPSFGGGQAEHLRHSRYARRGNTTSLCPRLEVPNTSPTIHPLS